MDEPYNFLKQDKLRNRFLIREELLHHFGEK